MAKYHKTKDGTSWLEITWLDLMAYSTSTTVLKFIQENAPYLKTIESASELQEDAADTNPYGMNVAFMYQKDPDKFAIESPIPFLQHPAQPKVLEIEVPCEARTAGAIIYYPLSALIIPGV